MTAVTSLSCPNCGAPLKAAAYAHTLKCPFCGTEHVINDRDGDFTFVPDGAACPVCGKSDRVASVTQILAHPSSGERATGLPKRLALLPPQYFPAVEPEKGSEMGSVKMPGDDLFWSSIGSLVIFFGFWYLVIRFNDMRGGSFCGPASMLFCLYGFGGWTWWFSIYFLNSERISRQAEVNRQRQLAREYPENLKRYQWELAQNKKIEYAYQDAREVWARLYYCGRDDCLYFPGEEMHAKPEQMVELLKQVIKKD